MPANNTSRKWLYHACVINVAKDKHGITFSADELKRFWRHYRQHMPQHPASDEHVPVGLAGDDTQYNLAGAKLIINLVSFPLYDPAASKLCRWPYFVLRYEVSLGERTLDPIWRVAAWSLNIAFGSVHPAHGPLGETWRKGSARATLAGKNLLCSYALTELRGDWKYHRETFCLKRHYTANDICLFCCASKKHGASQPLDQQHIAYYFCESSSKCFGILYYN